MMNIAELKEKAKLTDEEIQAIDPKPFMKGITFNFWEYAEAVAQVQLDKADPIYIEALKEK